MRSESGEAIMSPGEGSYPHHSAIRIHAAGSSGLKQGRACHRSEIVRKEELMIDRNTIASSLRERGFTINEGSLRVSAEKDGCRFTMLYSEKGNLDAVIEEIADTSTVVKLIARPDRNVTLSASLAGDGRLCFTRTDPVTETSLLI